LFWQPAGAQNILRSMATVQHRRPVSWANARRIQCLDMRPDLESLQGGAVGQEISRLFRSAKTRLSLVLGLLMLTFGFLKFVNPTIDGWFHVQIQQSHLPHSALLIGKIAEIMTGILFLLPRIRPWQAEWEGRILLIACSSLFLEMLVAVYVHLHPGVPPEVLPLGIKPPVIPLFVLLLDVMVAVPAWKDSQIAELPIC
jgi:uncharacterized membrane protein